MERWSRQEFSRRVDGLDAAALRKVLWNLYWRAPVAVRVRIEDTLEPGSARVAKPEKDQIDGGMLLDEVRDFCSLARGGDYMGGSRLVSRAERSKWRLTFARLFRETREVIEQGDLDDGRAALETLVDLACETQSYCYFHSEDPVEAAKVVISDHVAALWHAVLQRQGVAALVTMATQQLIWWESTHGWTRSGFGATAERERSLAELLAEMLPGADAWTMAADAYLHALDAHRSLPPGRGRALEVHATGWHRDNVRNHRADRLAGWHRLLLDKLMGSEAEDRLDKLVSHPALDGPELWFVSALLAHARGQIEPAKQLVHRSLEKLPGHRDFLAFAKKIGVSLPTRRGTDGETTSLVLGV